MATNSEARKRAEEKQPTTVDTIQLFQRDDLEKLLLLYMHLMSEVHNYCQNIAELAPFTKNADADKYNEGVAEGRRRQASNTITLINEVMGKIRRQVNNAQV